MINTILEVLAAVVVLIVIIAVLALRYLRADDSDTFDDIPDEPRRNRREPESPRDRAKPAGPERRARSPEPVGEPAWQADARSQPGLRDRDTGPRPVSPDRTAGAESGRSRRETVSARAGRQARPAEADSLTNSWESLSDVDYWAGLAADDVQDSPAAGPMPAGRSRNGQQVPPDVRPPATPRRPARADAGRLPVRQRHLAARPAGSPGRPAETGQTGETEQLDMRAGQPGRYPNESAVAALEALGRRGATSPQRSAAGSREPAGQRPAATPRPPQAPRPQSPAVPAASPSTRRRAPAPADDDPLTSPSFPAITAADSRSYRTRRHAASQPGAGPQPNGRSGGVNGYDAPGQQNGSYPAVPDRATSRPDGYPVQASALPPAPGSQPAGAAGLPPASQQPTAPAANPYGSYVSAPQHTYADAASQQTASFVTPPPGRDAPSYGGYQTGQQPVPGSAWHGAPASTGAALPQPFGQPADGYLPPAGLGGNGAGSTGHLDQLRGANGTAAYAGIDYGSIRYDTPVYADGQQALAGYGTAPDQLAGHYDQHGYGPDTAYGQDGHQGYPRHGADGR